MTDEAQSSIQLLDFTEEDVAELVRGIDRDWIIHLVKTIKHLQRRVFSGFRPSHLPWDKVPAKLAHDAVGDVDRLEVLLGAWIDSNEDLLDAISALPPGRLREGVIELLVRRGVTERRQILWALQLDERPEVQTLLEEGLARELSEEASGLVNRAKSTLLSDTLEETQSELAQVRAERDEAREEAQKFRSLADHHAKGVGKWRSFYEEVVEDKDRLQNQVEHLEKEHQTAQEANEELAEQLRTEQQRAYELGQSVEDLKSSLAAQAKDRELDRVLLDLEAERKNAARLRLKVESLTQERQNAYEKRDRVVEQVESLEQATGRLNHDKEVIIEQKRHLQERVQALQSELRELRMRRREQIEGQVMSALPIADLDSTWLHAREEIRDHIHGVVSALRTEPESAVQTDKLTLWQNCLERELNLVKEGLAALDAYANNGVLPDIQTFQKAQELLTLRWYLLECTKQAIQRTEMASFPV
jgi:chromosome segregation ATPase